MWHLNLTAERGESEKRMWFAKNSRRSDSRAREKKKRGVQLNSLPTYRRALLSERLEQASTNQSVL